MKWWLVLWMPLWIFAASSPFPPTNRMYYEITTGQTITLDVSYLGVVSAWSNRPDYVTVTLTGTTITLTALDQVGYASFSYNAQYGENPAAYAGTFGIVIEESLGTLPGLPDYLAMGSCSFPTAPADIQWWGEGGGNGEQTRWVDFLHVYFQGGPYDWVADSQWLGDQWYPGAYLAMFIQGCKKMGRIPCIVMYCIPKPKIPDSALGDLENVNDPTYMNYYYNVAVRTLREIVWQNSQDGWPMLVVLEPDFLGYMMQTIQASPTANPITYGDVDYTVQVNNILYTATNPLPPSPFTTASSSAPSYIATYPLLTDSDPTFNNTLYGLVTSIPYILKKQFTDNSGNTNAQLGDQIKIGWKMNLWASPGPGGFSGKISSINNTEFGVNKGICRWTDVCYPAAKPTPLSTVTTLLKNEVAALATQYYNFGITKGSHFLTLDRYGRDGSTYGDQGGYAGYDFVYDGAIDPTLPDIKWCWNGDHWYNYLTFVQTAQSTIATLQTQASQSVLPVLLWQLPMGHLNNSTALNPSTGSVYTPLANAYKYQVIGGDFEDAGQSFIFGDTFNPGAWPTTALGGIRASFYAQDLYKQFSSSGGKLTWPSHLTDFVNSGVFGIISAPGVGLPTCTYGVSQQGQGPYDSLWWINHAQTYYQHTIPLVVPIP